MTVYTKILTPPSYGRDLSIDILETKIPAMERLSEVRLKDSLELVFNVARDTDMFLLNNHIGSFEELIFFHGWRHTLKGTCRLDESQHLRKALCQMYFGKGLKRKYCDDLVRFYHSC